MGRGLSHVRVFLLLLLFCFGGVFFKFCFMKGSLGHSLSFAVVWEPGHIIKTETVGTFCSYAHTISFVISCQGLHS